MSISVLALVFRPSRRGASVSGILFPPLEEPPCSNG
jgi:hypothetical protein